MPFVPVPDAVMVELLFVLDGQHIENTLYYSGPANPDSAQIEGLVLAVIDAYVENILAVLSADLSFVGVKATDLTTATSTVVDHPISPAQVGGILAGAEPNNVAYAVSLKTATRGRSFRGRNYVPGIPDTEVTNSRVSSDFRTNIRAGYLAMMNIDVDVDTWDLGVVSRFTDGAPRDPGIITFVTDVGTFDDVLDSQRRRLPGRGT